MGFEDGGVELLTWADLRRVLVPHPQRDAELAALEAAGAEGFVRASGRPRRSRNLRKEVAAYLPRRACHNSLPPGKGARPSLRALEPSFLEPSRVQLRSLSR